VSKRTVETTFIAFIAAAIISITEKLVDDPLALDSVELSRPPWRFLFLLTPKTEGYMCFASTTAAYMK
jgi:hypothetical protein